MGLRCSKAAAHELKVRTVLHPAPLGSEAESYMIYHKSQFIYIYIIILFIYGFRFNYTTMSGHL